MAKAEPTGKRLPVVEGRKVESRALVTIGPEHGRWRTDGPTRDPRLAGALVRVRPPEGATDEDVRRVVAGLEGVAVAVKVEPRPRSSAVPDEALARAPTSADARAVVMRLVDEANTEDRAALREVAERVLGKVGL